jgi:hypothetical protein
MVVAVVTPVVFVLRLIKNVTKILKLVFLSNVVFITTYCKTYYKSCNTKCSLARAQTTLVQWNTGILGIIRKLLSLKE